MSVLIQNPRQFDWSKFDILQFDPIAYNNKVELKYGRPSVEYVRKELIKCQQSFSYFCRNYIFVQHPIKGFVEFELRKYQHRIAAQYESNRFCIMRKSRQMGCSTITAIWLLWKALMCPEPLNIVVLSIGNRESMDFLKHIRNAFKRLPKWLGGRAIKENDHELIFDNSSSIRSLPSPKQAGRGIAASILVLDESAFIQNIGPLFTASYMTISTGGKVIALSTVNGTYGVGQWFFEMWNDAVEGNNDFFPIDLNYFENDEFNEEWAEITRKNIGEKRFRQEVLKEFAGSVETYLPYKFISKLLDLDRSGNTTIREPIEKFDLDMMWVFERPIPGEVYLLGADVAKQGKGKSNSSFQIIKASTMEQVAEFLGRSGDLKIGIEDYAKAIDKYGRMYNNAYALVEVNNMGLAVVLELYNRLKYPNLHCHRENVPGWETNGKTRPLMITKLYDCCDKEYVTIRSIRTLKEMQTFAQSPDTGKVEKQKNSTDDLLIGLSIALVGIDVLESKGVRFKMPIMDGGHVDNMTLTDEQIKLKIRKELNIGTPYTMESTLPNGDKEQIDIGWLIG